MPDLNEIYLFRMTHIDNVPHIVKYGITHVSSANANIAFVPIGDSSLISSRNEFKLKNGKRLGDYVPFYFGVRTPMLYVVQNGFNMVAPTNVENIVYCVSSVQQIINLNLDFIFTDGHAVDNFSTQYSPADIDNINSILDFKAIKSRYWKDESDLDLKRRKEAEFLVLGDIAPSGVMVYAVYNENAKNKLCGFGIDAKKILIKTGYYF